ncbi:hypothetical protein ACFE04_013376 [Oxalis oulophora]
MSRVCAEWARGFYRVSTPITKVLSLTDTNINDKSYDQLLNDNCTNRGPCHQFNPIWHDAPNQQGFRKVDPDKWEFASEWFLRGQKHLLRNIIRRKQSKTTTFNMQIKPEIGEFDEDEMMMEIGKLKEEQRSLEDELEGMNQRLAATERRPEQMMAFLCKVVEDPELLPRMMLRKVRTKQLPVAADDKKRRLLVYPSMTSSSSSGMAVATTTTTTTSCSTKSEEEEDEGNMGCGSGSGSGGAGGVMSSPESSSFDYMCQPVTSPEGTSVGYFGPNRQMAMGQVNYVNYQGGSSVYGGVGTAIEFSGDDNNYRSNDSGGQNGYFGEMAVTSPPPYPFSLLEGGF